MKKTKSTFIAVVIVLLSIVPMAFAQEIILTAGGEAAGNNGSVTYSVGQVAFQASESTAGSLSEGIQIPYEIYDITNVEDVNINLKATVYPNPVSENLILDIKDCALIDLSYQIFDMNGKILKNESISNSNTMINMSSYTRATYFIKVFDNNKIIKTFKIIKN